MQHKLEELPSSNTGTAVRNVNFIPLPDSDNYLQKLESRLSKVKGLNKDLTSKDMISVMQNARDDFMNHLISNSVNQLSFSEDDVDKEVSTSYLEKKLFPEKSGVTYEELQHLLECDVLAKTSAERNPETLNDHSLDR